jgi:phosphoribosylcarboxyaminoimidazole (NCAIR) mutase
VTLALPYIGVPIKEDLVRAVQAAVSRMDATLQIHVKPIEASQRERAALMAASE